LIERVSTIRLREPAKGRRQKQRRSQSGRRGSERAAHRDHPLYRSPGDRRGFADAVTGLLYDGQTLRMEFSVTRFDEIEAQLPISGRRYPACRLALSRRRR